MFVLGLDPGHILRLWSLLSLSYLKLHLIAFLLALVAIGLDGAVVHKHIWTIVPTNESEPLGIVKPLHFTFYW